MSLTVKCYATLTPFQPAPDLAFEPGDVAALAARLGIPPDEVAIVFRNGVPAGLDTQVRDGDEIKLFPVIGGG
jgi:sulfur carrier protein ThiS